ncbi:uracil-DNA glycosylase [candidate division WWE3 bacterium CG08_land_8_20_14_0_20_41_15]|uniref:Type-4 uracil-DNA glycosylase n=1 Tax=candidate division WWE3 bacterium CG08_land_8_20_14_0_20_41_15 TaxID=1975086 RepID=A0A2H0XA99_UNCKA|nr:MAG: uracil-DNA glycosylase [candidate division WWE3 bacterium CG08_land_8_20_14_0_20_41_15]
MDKRELLAQIEKQVGRCKECRLYRTRNKPVPGVGSTDAKAVFVGEAPGASEDERGVPFCGRAGDLLDELLDATHFKRSDVWIGNVIKCRPPDNRQPMVDELRSCKPYLEEQLKVLNPKVIVTLGKFAMDHFVKNGQISRDHGVPKVVGSYIIYPIYHPAAALRSTQVLMILRRDFLRIPKVISGEIKPEDQAPSKKKDEKQLLMFS